MDGKQTNFFQQQQQPDETFQAQRESHLDAAAAAALAGTFQPLAGAAAASAADTSSPRRRKAPIDIDTALRLQSQASYVQEPARASPASSASSRSISQASTCVQATPGSSSNSTPTTAGGAAATSSTATTGTGTSAGTVTTSTPSTAAAQQQQQQQHARSQVAKGKQVAFSCPCRDLDQATNYYDHYYRGSNGGGGGLAFSQQNNISVDYIDCLSNSDLQTAGPSGAGSQQQQHAMMRGVSAARKHGLGRFHRAHRVEPAGLHQSAGEGATLSALSAPAAAPTASSSGDESPPPPGASNARPSSGGCDSGSMVTSTNSTDCSSFDLQQQQQLGAVAAPSSTQSVLYPISVSEAKKRTYFIGSVSQDCLLGHDELLRYFPSGRVSIFVCTWNQNRKRAPLNLNDLLLPDQLVYVPDIYSVGIQEAYSSQADYLREWEIELQTTLGPSHVLLHSCSLGSLHLALFIRRDLIWFCSQAEESLYNSRSMAANMIKTKGAISIAFRFFGTSFMFTNCHFPAHENKLKDRIDEYQRIINSIDLPKNLKLLKPRYLSNDSTARFDCVFFMGDLNFRLEQRTFDETIQILDDIFQSRELSYEALTQNDELLKVMESQQAFHGFDESQIKFPPTYKFLAQTNKYDRQTKRVPSYTDRILFRSKRRRHIQCLIYDWLPQLMSSDHKPVYSLFDVLIRPGHEQNMVSSLNAGLFQRAVYIEALRRRAEDPDGIRDNGAGGNLICSIT